jgi:hypothetical protein
MNDFWTAVLIIMPFLCVFFHIVHIKDLFSMSAVSVLLNIDIVKFYKQTLEVGIMEFINIIYAKTLTSKNIISGFQKTGLIPTNFRITLHIGKLRQKIYRHTRQKKGKHLIALNKKLKLKQLKKMVSLLEEKKIDHLQKEHENRLSKPKRILRKLKSIWI